MATATGLSFGFDNLKGMARQLSLWSRRLTIRRHIVSSLGSNNAGHKEKQSTNMMMQQCLIACSHEAKTMNATGLEDD